jgi:hypothetical protein
MLKPKRIGSAPTRDRLFEAPSTDRLATETRFNLFATPTRSPSFDSATKLSPLAPTRTCDLCCEELAEGDRVFRCAPFVDQACHTFCADCMTNDVARTTSDEVDFEALSLRRGALVCPFALDLNAWRLALDFHESGALSGLLAGKMEEGDNDVSTLFSSFAAYEFNIKCDTLKEALAKCGCASLPFSDREVAQALPTDSAYDAYMNTRHRVRVDAILAEAQAEVDRCAREMKEAYAQKRKFNFKNALLSRQLKNQMPKARQCGSCGFGPGVRPRALTAGRSRRLA